MYICIVYVYLFMYLYCIHTIIYRSIFQVPAMAYVVSLVRYYTIYVCSIIVYIIYTIYCYMYYILLYAILYGLVHHVYIRYYNVCILNCVV